MGIGVEEGTKLLDKTLLVEESGGMPTASGDRRRTPGGVFLALLKQKVTAETWKEIFAEETRKKRAYRKGRRREAGDQQQKTDAEGAVASASVDASAAEITSNAMNIES